MLLFRIVKKLLHMWLTIAHCHTNTKFGNSFIISKSQVPCMVLPTNPNLYEMDFDLFINSLNLK